MTIGDVTTFAIEWELNEDHGGTWMFGKMCFWIGGRMVGDYSIETSLRDVWLGFAHVVGDCGKRWHERLHAMAAESAFSLLNEAVYGTTASHNRAVLGEDYAKYWIDLPLDICAGWRVFMTENESEARLLIGFQAETEEKARFLFEQKLHPRDFTSVVVYFQRELEGIWQREARLEMR